MTTRPRVLLSRRWPAAVEAKMAEAYDVTANTTDIPLTRHQFQEALRDYDAVCPTVTDNQSADALDIPNPRAKVLGNFGVGFSHIDLDAARSLGLIVTNTPGVLSDCTADIAMTLMLMVARRAGEAERELRAGQWTGWRPTHMIGAKITGKTLGIIGFGRIGQRMARKAHFGFDMQILAYGRREIPEHILAETGATQVASIDALLAQSDFVSLHCPGGTENHHLINADRLRKMKPDSFLINTARGEVVDENALAAALADGGIKGAGLDVFEGEPQVNSRLLDCDNAVLLPHLGSATRETREAMGFRVLDNLNQFFAGQEPQDRVA
jgi:glyoxylate reductase